MSTNEPYCKVSPIYYIDYFLLQCSGVFTFFILGKSSRFLCAIYLGHKEEQSVFVAMKSVFSILNLYLDSVWTLRCLLLFLFNCHVIKRFYETTRKIKFFSTFQCEVHLLGLVFVVFTYLPFYAELFLSRQELYNAC